MLLKISTLVFVILGFWKLGNVESPKRSHTPTITTDSGKIVYETYCLPCHQADGKGVPKMNPPIVQTDWVLGDKTRLIKVILKGLNDPVEINGDEFDNPMPAHDFLSDKQIAEVLTYVRANFGNKAEAVTIEEVKKLRSVK